MKKNAKGLYQKQITITVDGKKKQKAFYGKTIAEVNRKMLEYEALSAIKKEQGETFGAWLERWWDDHQTHIKRNTVDSYIKPVDDVKEYFGDMLISEIKPSHIKAFLSELQKRKYARQTINLRHIVLCKTFDYAIEYDVDLSNVARAVKLPSGLPVSKRETLTKAEIDEVKASKDLYANFLLYTGCRKNEAFAVRWEDIDLKNGSISITKAIVYNGNKPEISTPKSSSGIRLIPLLKPLEALLLDNKQNSGYIFNKEGKLLEKKQARALWDNFLKKVSTHITPHQFRHAFVTMMYDAGVDVKAAQAIAGHSKVEVTLNIYTHLAKNSQDESKQKMDKYLSI